MNPVDSSSVVHIEDARGYVDTLVPETARGIESGATAARGGKIRWPNGKSFAFTITDDTDRSTLESIRPVYDVLENCGLRTTKTVWPLRPLGHPITGGDTLEDRAYLEWVFELKKAGFEIALHGAADESSRRERVQLGFDRFRQLFGLDPLIHINHVGQKEAVYWGADRLDPPLSWLYKAYRSFRPGDDRCEGHHTQSDYFWGDICRARTKFVRNLVWHDINTTRADPLFPYHDPGRPYVNHWFSASYGSGLENFLNLVQQSNLDRLEAEGGACIAYAHLGTFPPHLPEFREAVARIARMNGWFVPASTLIQHIGRERGWTDVSRRRVTFAAMQARWALQQFGPAGAGLH